MTDNAVDVGRRRFLTGTTAVIGGLGAATASVPFIASFQPSAKAKAIGAPVEVDIGKLEPGQRITQKWRGQPVWIVRRTQAMLDALKAADEATLRDPSSEESEQPIFAANAWRSSKEEYLVLVGLCTHLGCSPSFVPEPGGEAMGDGWVGGFFCPCHGSKFDLAGRVFKGVPAPKNLIVPPYRFETDTRIIIGESEGGAS
ncbi:MAG: ubiquinol-cytochrome c reductase iron-sulfur subunit [Gammaproteobacteria bacterium]|jgi:ubiquinol-cytochrome c reductase iron-sulfur subunit